jgi:threonine dehydrogenase-like Zn-dependent dehydrogenase
VVIEAVGTPQAITVAMDCARVGAKVVLAGSSRGLSRGVDWWSLAQQRGLTMVGAHISAVPAKDASHGRWTREQEGRLFLELLQTGRLKVRDLITWRAKPSESNAVYEVLVSGGREHVGIVFCWNGDGASAGVKSTSSNPYHRA